MRVRDFESQGRDKKKSNFLSGCEYLLKQTTPAKSIYKGERRRALRRKIQKNSGKELSKLLWNSYLYNYPKKNLNSDPGKRSQFPPTILSRPRGQANPNNGRKVKSRTIIVWVEDSNAKNPIKLQQRATAASAFREDAREPCVCCFSS